MNVYAHATNLRAASVRLFDDSDGVLVLDLSIRFEDSEVSLLVASKDLAERYFELRELREQLIYFGDVLEDLLNESAKGAIAS